VYNFEIETEIKFLRTGKFQKSLFEDHVIDTQTKVRSKLHTIDVLWLNWKRSKRIFLYNGMDEHKCPYTS
jgi:hypothetical protein